MLALGTKDLNQEEGGGKRVTEREREHARYRSKRSARHDEHVQHCAAAPNNALQAPASRVFT